MVNERALFTLWFYILFFVTLIIHTVLVVVLATQAKFLDNIPKSATYLAVIIVISCIPYFIMLLIAELNGVHWIVLLFVMVFFLLPFVIYASKFANKIKDKKFKNLIIAHLLFTIFVYVLMVILSFVAKNLSSSTNTNLDNFFEDVDVNFVKERINEIFEKDVTFTYSIDSEDTDFIKEVKNIIENSVFKDIFKVTNSDDITDDNIIDVKFSLNENVLDNSGPITKTVYPETENDPIKIMLNNYFWSNSDIVTSELGFDNLEDYKTYAILHHLMHVIGYDNIFCDKTTVFKNTTCPVMFQSSQGCKPYKCGSTLRTIDFNDKSVSDRFLNFFVKKMKNKNNE